MFGRESSGVPQDVHEAHENIRIPMIQSSTRKYQFVFIRMQLL